MTLFVANQGSLPHGVYAQNLPPPALISPTGSGNSICVGQFPWGPSEVLTYPGSMGAFWQTFAPAGMPRTGSAHLGTINKAWPSLGAVRVADPTAVAATCIIQNSGLSTVLNITAISTGTAGNGITVTIGAPDDGVTGHFNLTAQVSSASGTTTEIYSNCNITGTGADVLPNLTNSVLLGSVTKALAGTPVFGITTMSGGTAGTITSTLYVGTPGGNDNGFALLEADNTIDGVFTDDPGNTLRAAINAGLSAHAQLTTDRIAYISGNSGQTATAAQTDAANYRSTNCVYTDPWASSADDTTGALHNLPAAPWAASVAAQLPPSVSPAWKASFVTGMLVGIASLESNRAAVRAQNTAAGIMTLIKGAQGGFAFEAGVNTSLTAGYQDLTRTRMGIYIARSAVNAWYPYVDAPNVPFFQQDLVNSLTTFLTTLKNNQKINPAVLPYILNFAVLPPSASNTAATIANGNYSVAAQIQTGSQMSKVFLNMQYGPTVTIAAA